MSRVFTLCDISIADQSTPWLWCRLEQYWYQFTTTLTMVLSIASDLKTRQLVWVRNGIVKTSVEWAALGRSGRLWSATINEVHHHPIRCLLPPTTLLLSSPIWNPATAQFLTGMPRLVPSFFTFPTSLLPTTVVWRDIGLMLVSSMSGHWISSDSLHLRGVRTDSSSSPPPDYHEFSLSQQLTSRRTKWVWYHWTHRWIDGNHQSMGFWWWFRIESRLDSHTLVSTRCTHIHHISSRYTHIQTHRDSHHATHIAPS